MTLAEKEIERPLGQPLERRNRSGLPLPGPGKIVLGLAAAAVLGGSAVLALREQPFRKPPVEIAAVEVPAETPAPAPAVPPRAEMSRQQPLGKNGPTIIKVAPQQGSIVIRDPSTVGQDLQVAHIPDRALIEDAEEGPLPARAVDGRRPFDVYARPWSGARGTRVAIVIGGLGLSQTGTQSAIAKLPPEVTLAFATQGNSLDRWMQAARREGHELVMQLPLEPFDYPKVDPGRNTLTVDGQPEETLHNLHWALSRITNYTTVMNYMGARFVADQGAMSALMAELGKRGIGYLDDGSTARSLAAPTALKNGVPFAAGDIALDAVRDRGEVLKKLDELERTARARGYAVGIGSAFDVTVDAVKSWAAEARRRGIEIVPISAVANDPQRS